jgi:hypothetical protein
VPGTKSASSHRLRRLTAAGILAAASWTADAGLARASDEANALLKARFMPVAVPPGASASGGAPDMVTASLMESLPQLPSFSAKLAPSLAPQTEPGQPSAAAAPLPAHAGAGTVSGLPWPSGVSCGTQPFERMRGRRADVYVEFMGKTDWSSVIRAAQNSAKRHANRNAYPGRLVASVPMLTNSTRGQLKQCANGSFDDELTKIAKAFADRGLDNIVFRLGWEPNGYRNFPWSAAYGNPEIYKTCFRRQVMAVRSQLPNASVDWTNRRGNDLPYPIEMIYPGDDFVDIIGVMIYDRWPVHFTEGQWQAAYRLRDQFGGPKGLESYLELVRARGKQLSVSEWAVSNNDNDPSSRDNPFFIEKMFQFFRDNASQIAYEAYFNCGTTRGKGPNGGYRLAPTTHNPKSKARYAALWGPAD